MFISRIHHQAVIQQLRERLDDKEAELDRALEELETVRRERDKFRDLFVQAMGAKWNEEPIQQIPLQTRTLEPQAAADFEQMTARWSPAERAAFECWRKDIGLSLEEPEKEWLRQFGGDSPLEVLQ